MALKGVGELTGKTAEEMLRLYRRYYIDDASGAIAAHATEQIDAYLRERSDHVTLPTDHKERKQIPLVTGLLDYFPDACVAVAECSRISNEQHNPGSAMHWDRDKSGDEVDSLGRHLLQRGTMDTDGIRHSTKVAWRALAALQKELEADDELHAQLWENGG